MKKISVTLLLLGLAFLGFSSLSLAQSQREARLTVAPAFFLLNQNNLEKFNETVSSSGNFNPLEGKGFPGIVINATAPLKNSDLWLGTSTLITWAKSEKEEQTLTYAAVGLTISVEKLVQLADKLQVGYGGLVGYGISSVGAQFEEDGSLGEQLERAKYSQANDIYYLTGLKGEISYEILDGISLTCQAQYLLPWGSYGTKDFDLPMGGPSVLIGLLMHLP
ncbi:MAG: hypothetical protein GX766_05495 [Firmicutes bacterium]|nr:hypothetical protein [Bacillota bacterium]HQD40120.1 hypothetical protein [Bacillota bacterium]